MKYLFFGTPEFAFSILSGLIKADLSPMGVVCNPDRPVGRKKVITPPPVKTLALENGIKIFQPEKLSGFDANGADFAIVAAYSKIIPQNVLDMFPKGVIGIHPSLLPKYRGATPIQSAILAGEKETGVTLYMMDGKVDHGEIINNGKIKISEDDSYSSLENKSAELAVALVLEFIKNFNAGKIITMKQDESRATLTKKFVTQDGFVDPEVLSEAQNGASLDKAIAISRKIKALNPEPGVFTLSPSRGGPRRMKILEVELSDGKLKLKRVQYDGEKPKSI